MQIKEIINTLEEFAPLALQEEYDNAGVQIQSVPDEKVSGVLLCLDVTEKVIDEAVYKHCNLIVSHHPLMFRPQKKITPDDYIGRCILSAIKNGITIYSAHTNLDNAEGGVNFRMAERLELNECRFLSPLRKELPGGSGLIGTLSQPMNRDRFLDFVKDTFKAKSLRYNDSSKTEITTVALCGGAGAFLLPNAINCGADVFITGEVGYHRFFGLENDILLVELGHYETEQYTIQLIHDILADKHPGLQIFETDCTTNPIMYK